MSPYRLAIDYGTSRSGAAIADLPAGEARTVYVNGRSSIASVVVLREGELLVGEAAENAAGIRPGAAVASPKRFLGQHQPLFREPRRIEPEEAVAATLRALVAEAAASRGGRPPDEVFLTYPARWGATRQAAFREAAKQAGIESPYLIPELVAAALRLATGEGLAPGAFVAVYDLGAGMFDTAVLQRTAAGFVIHGAPGGLELGGDSFDERLYRLLGKQLDAPDWDAIQNSDSLTWRRAQGDFRRRVRLAKEALSRSAWVDVQYPGPADHEPIRLTRDELDDQIRADITATINELDRTITAAGLTRAGLAALYAAGGSSRIPLVEAMIVDAFGPSVRVQNDTMNVGALGAASASWAALEGTVLRQQPSAGAPPVASWTPAAEPPPAVAPPVVAPPPVITPAPPPVAAPPPVIPPPLPPTSQAPIAWPAPPARPPSRTSSPAGPRSGARPRTPLVLAGIAAAGVGAILLSQVAGLFGGSPASSSLVSGQGSPGPVSAAPGAGVERSAAQATLLGTLPADVRERCEMAADNVAPGGGERAAVTCPGVPGGSGHFVDYFLFANDDQMTSAFNRFVATRVGLGEQLDLTCPGRWKIASEEAGDLACFVVKPTSEFPSGQAYMAWTAEGRATLAIAARPDPFIGALHATIEKLRIR